MILHPNKKKKMIDLKWSYMYIMYEMEVVVYNYSVYTMLTIHYIFS